MKRVGWVLTAVGGLGVMVGAAQEWFSAPVAAISAETVTATGLRAVPGLVPLLLVIAAGLVARAMMRGIAAHIVGWLTVIAAAGLLWVTIAGLGDGERILLAVAAETTGVAHLQSAVAMTMWPYLAVVCAGMVLGGTVVLLRRSAPAARTSQYERSGTANRGEPSAVSDWDALTRGEDPSDPASQSQ